MPLALSCNNPPSGQVTKSPQPFIASGGLPPYIAYVITVGTLPPGLSLDPVLGVVTGIPTIKGTFPFTVQVTDSVPSNAAVACSISVCGLNTQGKMSRWPPLQF